MNDSNHLPACDLKTLVLCRTPFQAVILRQVLKCEGIARYDLVYFTQNNAEEDLCYFKELSAHAEQAQYLFLEKQKFDILNHLQAYLKVAKEIKKTIYAKVIISSFDNLAFRKLAVKNKHAQIISFDDGTGHINKYSDYLLKKNKIKSLVYDQLFRVPPRNKFVACVKRHYSVYRDFENIMPRGIIEYLDLFAISIAQKTCASSKKYFIGQPSEEFQDPKYVLNLKKHIENINFDFYVRHPRETLPLSIKFPVLEKQGRIAEEAILKSCGHGRPIIVGGFSTVLINISPILADKVMILRRNVGLDEYYAELGKKAGCEIIYI